ncbi:MAG: IS66 Orf2 family protein [uncultured bacterium]|nr:MAG: IS66 Orf2 family protein [uncultured bacterium]
MFNSIEQGTEIYLCKDAIDFRKGINGLSESVELYLKHNPLSGNFFVFINRSRDKIKILYWDRNGFCLWQKRLEKGKYHWPKHLSVTQEIFLTVEQLKWLLEGYNLKYWKPHPELKYKKVC